MMGLWVPQVVGLEFEAQNVDLRGEAYRAPNLMSRGQSFRDSWSQAKVLTCLVRVDCRLLAVCSSEV